MSILLFASSKSQLVESHVPWPQAPSVHSSTISSEHLAAWHHVTQLSITHSSINFDSTLASSHNIYY